MKNVIGILFVAFLSFACETIYEVHGFVTAETTDKPIAGVEVTMVVGGKRENTTVTDSLGRFDIHSLLYSCVLKCPGAALLFQKKGYQNSLLPLDTAEIMIVRLKEE